MTQRILKFRAWHQLTKEILPVETIDWDETQYLTEVSAGYTWGEKFDPAKFSHLVLMQYTGLRDKNGKECYEGDKVKNRLTEHYGTVVYTDEFATFNVVDEKGKWVCSMGAMNSDGFEITGNIYEN